MVKPWYLQLSFKGKVAVYDLVYLCQFVGLKKKGITRAVTLYLDLKFYIHVHPISKSKESE